MKKQLSVIALLFCALLIGGLAGAQYFEYNPEYEGAHPTDRFLSTNSLMIEMQSKVTHFYPEGLQQTIRHWREYYVASNGAIVLSKTIVAIEHPAIEAVLATHEWPSPNER